MQSCLIARIALAVTYLWLCSQLLAEEHRAQQHLPGIPPNCENILSEQCPDYPPPTCNVTLNNDYTYQLARPMLASEVGPAIQTHYGRHYSTYPTYTLPVTFLWDALGIGNLMDDPNPKIDCCNNILFTRDGKKPSVAKLDWKGHLVVKSKQNSIFNGFKLTITIQDHLSGLTNVSAGFTEFLFDPTGMPHLTVTAPDGSSLFDSDLGCIKAAMTDVVAKPREPSGTQQRPDFYVHP